MNGKMLIEVTSRIKVWCSVATVLCQTILFDIVGADLQSNVSFKIMFLNNIRWLRCRLSIFFVT